MNKQKLYWYCQVGGWLLFNVIEVISYGSFIGYGLNLYVNALVNMILGITFTHLYRMFLLKTNWLALPLYKLIPRAMSAILILSVLMTLVNVPLDRQLFPVFQQFPITIEFIFPYFFNLSKYILLWALIYHLFQYWERSLKAERDKYQMEATMKENQYNNLKMQLNPHFLFNSLNSIRTLIDLNPETAKTAVTQLSGLLRSSLYMGKSKTVSLRDELQTMKDYIEIETIRFDERLKMKYDIDPAVLHCEVPPMMLQTLVENAVKHGISNTKHGGEITVKAGMNGKGLKLSIINTGQYIPRAGHIGLGIANTVERLNLLYDDKASFSICNLDQQLVLTEVIIPA